MLKNLFISCFVLTTLSFSFSSEAATKKLDYCLNCNNTQFISKAKNMTPSPHSQSSNEEIEEMEPTVHYIYLVDPISRNTRKYRIEVDNNKRIRTQSINSAEKEMFNSVINYYHVSKEIDDELQFTQQDIANYSIQKNIPTKDYYYRSGSVNDGLCNDAYHYVSNTDCRISIEEIITEKYNDRNFWEKISDAIQTMDLHLSINRIVSATIKGQGKVKLGWFKFDNGSILAINIDTSLALPALTLNKNISRTARGDRFSEFEKIVKDLNSANLTANDADLIVDYYSQRGYTCTARNTTKTNYRYKVISKIDNNGVKYFYIDVHTSVSDESDIECRSR